MPSNHTTARIGKHMFVRLTSGKRFVDKLKDIRSGYYLFEREGKINAKHIKSLGIDRSTVRTSGCDN